MIDSTFAFGLFAGAAQRLLLIAGLAGLLLLCACDAQQPQTGGDEAQPPVSGPVPTEARELAVPEPAPPADALADAEALPAPAARIDDARAKVALQAIETSRMLMRTQAQPDVGAIMPPSPQPAPGSIDRDRFEEFDDNSVKITAEEPVSTFSIDVDTAAYAVMRRYLNDGALPPRDAIRTEELINYFSYDYPLPRERGRPFAVSTFVYPTPWRPDSRLLHIGIKGYDMVPDQRPPANLVLLLDVSGSMSAPDKLPLLKKSMRLLLAQMDAHDSVAMVVYAGAAGTVLEPTKGSEKAKILAALERLSAGGSTAGGEGIRQAYALAEAGFKQDAVNRVILATDGDFNVGINDPARLEDFVAEKRKTGVFLTVLGFGRGNYQDALMQKLAQAGNGNAAYIDTLREAQKVLVDEMGGTLFPIAKDVKIQVEFNPAQVAEYRLIGYETRLLKREDFNNDQVDAGDIGSGHSVTAIYELIPVGSDARFTEPLRYQAQPPAEAAGADEIAFVRLRYKLPEEDSSKLMEVPVPATEALATITAAPEDVRFAAAVAAFGQRLRGGRFLGDFDYAAIRELGQSGKGADPFGYRAEFLQLVRLAATAAGLPALEPLGRPGD